MKILAPVRRFTNFSYRFLNRLFANRPFRLLDVGSGNRSASRLTAVFPRCLYHGLDRNKAYNYDAADFSRMQQFYEVDLTKLEFGALDDGYFDAIWMVHVIEHLSNGEAVVAGLFEKLRPGGCFYIEYPGQRSTKLPSMYGTLNFYDDPSHVRLYEVKQLANLFEAIGGTVIKKGTRRNWFYIVAMPFRLLGCVITRKKVEANIFWDLLGFAEFLLVRKDVSRGNAQISVSR